MKHLPFVLIVISILSILTALIFSETGVAVTLGVTILPISLKIWIEQGHYNDKKVVNRYKSRHAYDRINNPRAVNRYKQQR